MIIIYMLEIGIVIFIVLILLYIVFFGGLPEKAGTEAGVKTKVETKVETRTGTETKVSAEAGEVSAGAEAGKVGAEAGAETTAGNVSAGAETNVKTKVETTADTLMVDGKKCTIIETDAIGHCGYIAVMYALKKSNNAEFNKIFSSLTQHNNGGKLKYSNEDVQTFYNLIVKEAKKKARIENEEFKRIGNGTCIKEMNHYFLIAISTIFKVNIHIHYGTTGRVDIMSGEPHKEYTSNIHLLYKGSEGNSSGHYDILDCS